MTPTPPTSTPDLYKGNPPGSAASPSGEPFGPALTAPERRTTSEQVSDENCTPKSGPLGALVSPGLKCSWMIWPRVRVLKGLPSDDRWAAVRAWVVAASSAGTAAFSRPPVTGRPERM